MDAKPDTLWGRYPLGWKERERRDVDSILDTLREHDPMNWKFVIKTGEMFDPTGKKVWTGYAGGNCGHNPEGKNNPAMCSVHDIGPLPPGLYTFGQVFLQSHLGPYAIPLIPDPANDMLGRSGFFCHGDTTPSGNASKGCIIAPRYIREAMYEGHVRTIRVTAE